MKFLIALHLTILFSLQLSLGQDIKVGILFDQFASTRWKIDEAALVSEFNKLGVETIVEVAHSNFDLQMEQGLELIAQKVSAIVIISVDGTRPHSFFSTAKEKGIPVIAYDRPIFDKRLDLYISYDNLQIGRIQAESVIKNIGSGNIIMVNGPVTDVNAIKFREGQMEVLKPHIESGRINIVNDIVLDSWNEATALLAMYEYSLDLEKVQGLLFALDSFVRAALEYNMDSEIFKNIYMTGQDPSPELVDRLKNNIQNMSILKPIQPLAKKTAELTISKIRNEKHPDIGTINFDENNSTNGYLFQPVVLDKNNIDDYKNLLYK